MDFQVRKRHLSLRSYFKIKHDHLPRQARDKQEHDSEAALKRSGELAGTRASVAAADGAAQEHQRDDGGPGSAGAKTAFF
eukprot:COSAG06_NODE_10864_length_1605_cov_1.245684_1_plen_80_part_00